MSIAIAVTLHLYTVRTRVSYQAVSPSAWEQGYIKVLCGCQRMYTQTVWVYTATTTSTAYRWTIWWNCAFNDRSMKFGTLWGHVLGKIFGYRAIQVLSRDRNGRHFQNGCWTLITNVVFCCVDQNTCDFAVISRTALRIEKVQIDQRLIGVGRGVWTPLPLVLIIHCTWKLSEKASCQ